MVKLPHWPIHTGHTSFDSPTLVKKVLELMGNPHQKLKNVIHVGGTNGKGSTIAFISQILLQEGFAVNVYTSPHIFDFTERFVLNGEKAKNDDVFMALEEVRAVCEKNNIYPTVLEASTIAAFYLFSTQEADYNIIECCMGGLRDCTNVFDTSNLVCTVITSISKDHTVHLGETIAEISFQKAGIQRRGVSSIIARQKEEDANRLFYNYSKKFGISTLFFGADYSIEKIEPLDSVTIAQLQVEGIKAEEGYELFFTNKENKIFLPKPSLLGEHQLENLATALQVACCLGISMTNVQNAVVNTKWVGRLQRVYAKYLPHNCEFWFDGAHNAGGMKALHEWIKETKDSRENYIIIGKSKNSDQNSFIQELQGVDAKIIFVTVEGEIYPEVSKNLHKIAEKFDIPTIDGQTFKKALQILPREQNIRVIGCGSLYLLKDMKNCDA